MSVLLAPGTRAATSQVSVPVYLDYLLLDHLLVTQLFNTADGSREILNDPKGCNQIVLTEPGIGAQQEHVEITASFSARLGLKLFGSCRELLSWQGHVGFLGLPVIQPGARSVKLESRGVWMKGTDGKKILGGPLWNTAGASLKTFFSGFVLDLTPYTKAIGDFLPSVLPDRSAAQMQETVDSLSLGDVKVSEDNLAISINFSIEPLPEPEVSVTALSPEELQQFEERWHMMDALLVGAVKHYAAATELQSLRDALLDILLDSRYQLRDALTEPEGRASDAVRSWFIDSWHSLGPVIRKIAMEQGGQEHLMWFNVLTATDALYALDQLGSTIGLQISTEGLRRLSRMINAGDSEEMLHYSEDVDPELQKLLRQQIETNKPRLSALRFNFSLVSRAYAVSPADEVNRLVAARDNLDIYLPKVASLLETSADKLARERKIEPDYQALFEKLVLATAWQESCWRQYVVKDKRIVPLISTSGDIGLMQVNERVWRGFYDMNKLRWDINYNSRAGSEILLNYMVKYALKREEQKRPGGINNLARASYSAYNGGPGQVTRYRRADVASVHRKVDSLFWDKYQQVDAGKKMNVAKCLGDELAGPA